MQKKITLGSTLFLGIAVLLLTSASLQQKEKSGKGNPQKNDQKANNGNSKAQNANNNIEQNNGRGNNSQGRNEKQKEYPQNDGNNGNGKNKQKDNKDFKEKDNNGQGDDKNKNNDKLKFEKDVFYGYNWNDDDFRDRKRYKKQDKVTICHKMNRNGEPGVAISVSENAVKAHMNHGDVVGDCPAVSNTVLAMVFLKTGNSTSILYKIPKKKYIIADLCLIMQCKDLPTVVYNYNNCKITMHLLTKLSANSRQ